MQEIFDENTIVIDQYLLNDYEISRKRFTIAHEVAYYLLGKFNPVETMAEFCFRAFLYLKDKEIYPLQIFLKSILVQSESITVSEQEIEQVGQLSANISVAVRYCMIVVSTVPLFCVYPFVSKHFQKGVMVGSVKG